MWHGDTHVDPFPRVWREIYWPKTEDYCSKYLKKMSRDTLANIPSLPYLSFGDTVGSRDPLKCNILFEWPVTFFFNLLETIAIWAWIYCISLLFWSDNAMPV